MRKALNENPVVQLAVLGVLALFVAIFLFTSVLGGQAEEAAPPSAAAPVSEAGATSTPAPVGAASAPATTAPPAGSPQAGTPPAATPAATPVAGFEAGPGLPAKVVSAYEGGDTVVLLLTKRSAKDDRAIRRSVERLRGEQGVTLFVSRLRHVADYARITVGVDLSRVPAIVVLRPRQLDRGPVPEATVSYGFRGPESVLQAVEDARFDGKSVTYDP